MKKYIFYIFFLLLVSSGVFAQNQRSKEDSLAGLEARRFHARAVAFGKVKNYDSAVFNLKKASFFYVKAKDYGKYWEVQNRLAYDISSQGKFEEAREILSRIIEANSKRRKGVNEPTADALYNMGVTYFHEEDYDKEIEYLEKALDVRVQLSGEQSGPVASVKNALGIAYNRKSDYLKALEYFEEVVDIRQHSVRTDRPALATAYGNIAFVLRNLDRYDEALEYYYDELEVLMHMTVGREHLIWAKSYNHIANIHFIKGDYEKALKSFQESERLHVRLLGEKDEQTATDFNNIGACYSAMGAYDDALYHFERALEIRSDIFGDKHPEIAQLYNNIGAAYEQKKDHAEALKYHQKALAMRLELLGDKHPATATSYNNLGNTYNSMGRYTEALQMLNKSAAIWASIDQGKHTRAATAFNNIGASYTYVGEYSKALEYYNRSLNLRKELLGEKHPDVATSYNNIGVTHYFRGEYDEALRNYMEALEQRKELLGEGHPDLATSYNNIGVSYFLNGNYSEALAYYDQSIQIRAALTGPEDYTLAQAYNNIGATYFEMDEYDQALEFYGLALSLRQKQLGEKHPYVASALNNIGGTYFKKQDYRQALEYYHKSLISNITGFDDEDILHVPSVGDYYDQARLFNSFIGKAECLLNIKDDSTHQESNELLLRSAYNQLLAADTLIDRVRNHFSGESDKMMLANSVSRLTESGLRVCSELYQLTGDNDIRLKSFYFIEKSKANVLLASILAKNFESVPDSLQLKESELSTNISFTEQQLAEERAAENASNSLRMNNYREKLFKLKREYEDLIEKLETEYPEYHSLKYDVKIATVSDFEPFFAQNPKAVIVEYFETEGGRLYIGIVSKKGFKLINAGRVYDLEKKIRTVRNAVTYRVDKSLFENSVLLYEDLLAPVDKYLKDNNIAAKHLVIIGDGITAYLPFELLLERYPEKYRKDKIRYKKLPFALKKYAFSYALSATLFLNNQARLRAADKDLLSIAPVFGSETNKEEASAAQNEFYRANAAQAGSSSLFSGSGGYISALPGTRSEVLAIKRLHDKKKQNSHTLMDAEAKETELKRILADYKVIHFATHGFVNEARPKYSGLLLSAAGDTENDGILYAAEIYNLRLNAELVTLSACQTGLGKIVRGEGLIGMTRGFLFAGAQNVIVSLWKVSDQSTADMMGHFYKRLLRKKAKAYSLNKSKLKLLKSKEYDHPFYWSPFILMGN